MPNLPTKPNTTLAQKEAWQKLWQYLLSDNPVKTEKPDAANIRREVKTDDINHK
jgi:hypothetical protein